VGSEPLENANAGSVNPALANAPTRSSNLMGILPNPPPAPRLGPITHLGRARMRRRDRFALRLRLLLSNPPPYTDGKGVGGASL
jgi:hypothetical protein